jgi:hypothetical protein
VRLKSGKNFEQRFAGLPKLRLAPGGFYADMRTLRIKDAVQGSFVGPIELPIFCIHCRFINDPEVATPESVAQKITSTIEFRDAINRVLFTIDGRWGDTDQPQPGQATIELLSVDFQIGQTREVDIAFKYPMRRRVMGSIMTAMVVRTGKILDLGWTAKIFLLSSGFVDRTSTTDGIAISGTPGSSSHSKRAGFKRCKS